MEERALSFQDSSESSEITDRSESSTDDIKNRLPEWQNNELVRFTEACNVDVSGIGVPDTLPKTVDGIEVSLTWYKNWIINWGNQQAEEAIARLNDLHVTQTLSDRSFMQKTTEKFGDVVQLVQTYCQDWEDSPLDIITFFFCLAAFSNPQYHKSKTPIYNDKFLLHAYQISHFAFASYAGSKALVLKRLPLMKSSDYIDGCWHKKTLKEAPAWFLATEKEQNIVFLSLRGTKRLDDILVDLSAQYVPWRNGYAHRGFLKSLKQLEILVSPLVVKTMQQNPGYRLIICGHSMGAALSALLTLKWAKEHPEWNVRGYGFATPCCISKQLVKESKEIFTTFVHHFDAVTRLSMGSIQDLHNGMRLFSKKVGKSNSALALYYAMKKLTLNAENKSILTAASEISTIITKKLKEEWTDESIVSHLYPAGKIFQFWREHRGKDFMTFQMHSTENQQYGRLEFSRTMLSDHGVAGYMAAFENLLAISVIETKVWISMSAVKRERIQAYWNSWPDEDLFIPGSDVRRSLKQMDRPSKYKKRAYEMGMIRPFLLLVSLSPKRRAAVANLMGISLPSQYWYCLFDSHKEAWKMISGHRGFTSRANGIFRTFTPGSNNVTWYDIVHICCTLVKHAQGTKVNQQILQMFHGKSLKHSDALKASVEIGSTVASELEEIFLFLLYSLSENLGATAADPLAKAYEAVHPIVEESPVTMASIDKLIDGSDDIVKQDHSSSSSGISFYEEMRNDKEIQEMMMQLRNLGFVNDLFLKYIAQQQIDHSLQQRANEFYTWGSTIRKKDDRIKKRHIISVVGLGLVSAGLFLSIIPLIHIAPPLALIPATASVGIGMYAYNKSAPGGLLSMTVALLQQRIALAHHGINIQSYYF